MAELITWCRLMRTGPACAIPCDDCRIASRKYAIAGVDAASQIEGFYDAPGERHNPLTDQPSGFILTHRTTGPNMTPDVQAVIARLAEFTNAWPGETSDRIIVLRGLEPAGDPIQLLHSDLRALLAALDPAKETFGQRITRLTAETTARYPYVDPRSLMIYIGEPSPDHARRWITLDELQRIAEGLDAADPADPAEQPIAHVPTPAGLSYLGARRQQHPRTEL